LLNAFNISNFNIATVEGFYGILFTYFALFIAIYAVLLGANIIGKEERDKTVEFLCTKPVERTQIMVTKIGLSVVNILIFVGFLSGLALILGSQYNPTEDFATYIGLCAAAYFLIGLAFMGIGVLLASAIRRYRYAGLIAAAVAVIAFFLSIISGLIEELEFLKYFTPLKYFDTVEMLNELTIQVWPVAVSLAIFLICTIAGIIIYGKRDLLV
jgi:ABC-2 type transport system permease protein